MDYINISQKKILSGTIYKFSSELDQSSTVNNLVAEKGFWSTQKRNAVITEYAIIDFKEPVPIDFIEILPAPAGYKTFPKSFRTEGSLDAKTWMIIGGEKDFELEGPSYMMDLPLTLLRYLKLAIIEPRQNNPQYYTEIGRCTAGTSGASDINSSSTSLEKMSVKNLLDDDSETFWESAAKANSQRESILLDLGNVYHINRLVLGSSIKGFPENFLVDVSTDNSIWINLFEERNFKSESYKKYYWDISITPARYVRIEAKGVPYSAEHYAVRLSHLEICAAHFDVFHTHNIGILTPHASVFQSGIVKLARDGEESPGAVVQGSDRRLRDATTIFKGIVQFAEDGDDQERTAVQASDSRLKYATELRPGIIRLAYDREATQGTVIQGNDSRIQEAAEEKFGIVRLCPDGMYSENCVVTGNDSRLYPADTKSSGICKLAENGAPSPGTVVQADDHRLRDATTTNKGIAEFAEDGETKELVAVQGNDRRLKDATVISKGIVELAEDGEDRSGVVIQGNDRRLKDATTISKGIVELADDGEDRSGVAVQGDDHRLKDATTAAKGIVKLAEDGDVSPDVVVQGNDHRLKNATETTRGITRLAGDGEIEPLCAVQGNDRRLKDATTISKGIVELADDGEDRSGVAVQGNDRRLKDATVISKGIVELAEDGEDRPGVAVQGNDHRLKDAAETTKGIMRFAENGESAIFAAVQGSDRRLKDATTTLKGIVELAEDGEKNSGVAVQGSDRRLKDATTTSKGIVELAEDGEDGTGVAVQGSDRRLKNATEDNPGIVKLAKSNEIRSGAAVQASDERLHDRRPPLPHTHDYAPLIHDFNGHQGTLSIRDSKNESFIEITPPSDNSAIISGNNESKESGSIGVAGIAGTGTEKSIHSYGVVGHSAHVGVRGQSSGGVDIKGCGVMGLSRFGAGGVFSSEHSYAVVADASGKIGDYDRSVNLMGSGKAFYARGKSEFEGQIVVINKTQDGGNPSPGNFVEIFEVEETEYISAGDLLVISEKGNSLLTRSKGEYSRAVVGVVSGNPLVILNNSGSEKRVYPVTLSGKTLCKIDARKSPVKPGDLIVSSNTPGCGMAGTLDSFNKIGTVIGKALDGIDDGIGLIPIFITHL